MFKKMTLAFFMLALFTVLATIGCGGSDKACLTCPSEVPTFTSTQSATYTATASCPSGTTGNPVTITVTATATATSTISQIDADTKARAQALASATAQAQTQANNALVCTPIPTCTYLVETSVSIAYQGGPGTLGLSTSANNCSWTAVSNVSWISITSGSNRTGGGTVGYMVAGNPPGPSRTGTLTVAGKTVTVTQGANP